MRRVCLSLAATVLFAGLIVATLVSVSAMDGPQAPPTVGSRFPGQFPPPFPPPPDLLEGQRLFDRETFGGNGRTCLTCHSAATGTVSPEDARRRFRRDRRDPLFLHDGSDDGQGEGVSRMLNDATILMTIDLPASVTVADEPGATSVVLRRGIPTTINTPALDPVLMYDGRQPDLQSQAKGAIHDHAQATEEPTDDQLDLIKKFQQTDDRFFSSSELRLFARGGPAPGLPEGRTPSEKRGRRFFVDSAGGADGKDGLCAGCHSGPMLNQTNEFLTPITGDLPGTRFQNVLVSRFNAAGNPMRPFVLGGAIHFPPSPDPGRMLITGNPADFEVFKISPLRGVKDTAPYFHDNSAKTLADVVAHYARFFEFVTGINGPGTLPAFLVLSPQEQADMVAFLKLL
jgi:cytochrome c peroxidase